MKKGIPFLNAIMLLAFFIFSFACNEKIQIPNEDTLSNSAEAMQAPYVILISCDGFRWDYVQRFQPPHLSKFVAEGTQAESLIPCFPSKTFPNHYSIATGMYPEHHNLVDNSFYSPSKGAEYHIRDREKVGDGSWYGGTPLWVQAVKSNMLSASYFFVGSDADVQGIRPTYNHTYDGSVPNDTRVKAVLKWLDLPAEKRPHFIAMYFSDLDDVGHRFGPSADEKIKEKLFSLDNYLGQLFDGVKKTKLPVNIIIVSDHGMLDVPVNQLIATERIENEDLYRTVSNGAIAHIYLNEGVSVDTAMAYLKSKENHFAVYKTGEVPQFEFEMKNPNWGQLQVIPEMAFYFMDQRKIGLLKLSGKLMLGEHGFDVSNQDVHGIFYANGPAFKSGFTVPAVKNIHIYPLICKILGLDVPIDVDGKLEVLEKILK